MDGFQEGEEDVKHIEDKQRRKDKQKMEVKKGCQTCVGERQLIQSHREQKK